MFTDAVLTFAEHTMGGVCTELDAELIEFNGEADHVHLHISRLPAHRGDLDAGAATQRPHRLPGPPRIHRRPRPRPHAWTPVVAVPLRRLLRRHTAVDHQAIHRRTDQTALNAGLRPPINAMGSPLTEVRRLRPTCRSERTGELPKGLPTDVFGAP